MHITTSRERQPGELYNANVVRRFVSAALISVWVEWHQGRMELDESSPARVRLPSLFEPSETAASAASLSGNELRGYFRAPTSASVAAVGIDWQLEPRTVQKVSEKEVGNNWQRRGSPLRAKRACNGMMTTMGSTIGNSAQKVSKERKEYKHFQNSSFNFIR